MVRANPKRADPLPVHERTVGGSEVFQGPHAARKRETSVVRRDVGCREVDRAISSSTDDVALAGEAHERSQAAARTAPNRFTSPKPRLFHARPRVPVPAID